MGNYEFSYLNQTISGKIKYYSHLSFEGKQLFCNRVNNFARAKEFKGMDNFEITDEVKILVSAAAVQLTFGLEDYSLGGHDLIQIFPATFYNTRSGEEYKGLTLRQKLVALSWEDFKHGYFIDDDNFNLGLHELAHVLRLSVNTDDFDYLFVNYLDEWDEAAEEVFNNMRKYPDENFLRNYAAVCMSEFFSVCVEYFFEVPQKFSERLPEIYNHLCILLNQDPLNYANDYRLTDLITSSGKMDIKNKLLREWSSQADTFIVIGFFTGLLCVWFFVTRMQINFGTFCIISGYAFFSLLIITQLIRSTFTMRRVDTIDIMRMILISPFIALLTFSINYITPGKKQSEQYKITQFKIRELNSQTDVVEVLLENDALIDYPKLRTFTTETNTYNWKQVSYNFEKGIFGFKNVNSRIIITNDHLQIVY